MATIKFRELNATMLIVHGPTPPSDADWAALMHAGEAMGLRMRRCVVFADVPVNPTQRRQIAEVTKRAQTELVAVVTNSSLTRMLVTGLGWLTGIHKAFSPLELASVIESCNMSEQQGHQLLVSALSFARELGHDKLADQIGRHPLLRGMSAA